MLKWTQKMIGKPLDRLTIGAYIDLMTVAKPFRGTKVSHQMKTVQPTGRGRNKSRGVSVRVDPSIIKEGLTPAEMLMNERLEGGGVRVASKLYWGAVAAGDGTQIDANMAKIARGE